ncbi:MAG: DUF1592 domain-containing protein [Bryobacteraceae bacterium]|nr:DUF1592 domain-containing protein [Bryobacteraceae bacterium]
MKTATHAPFAIGIVVFTLGGALGPADGAPPAVPESAATFRQYCFTCHGGKAQMGGISLEKLLQEGSPGERFQQWRKVAEVLEERRMPPKGLPPVPDDKRANAIHWIDSEIAAYVKKHDGDPGRVTVRRLTSGEYAYAIEDLTGLQINTGIDSSSDSVGGEGFANFGDVQFMQDANLERYLEAAKLVANHAVIGSGPLEFFVDPGKTGFELSAIARIREIYAKYGFRTVSGEGGRPFGLERYGKAFYAAWRYQHRAALGKPSMTLKDAATEEGLTTRLVEHIHGVVTRGDLGYPSADIAARWKALPGPGTDAAKVRAACEEIQKYSATWPSWLFARGDLAAGGAGDESPLEFSDRTLKAAAPHRFQYFRGGRFLGSARFAPPAPGPVKVYVNVVGINPGVKSYVVWRNPTVGIRPYVAPAKPAPSTGGDAAAAGGAGQAAAVGGADQAGGRRFRMPQGPRVPLRSVLTEESAKKLNFGVAPDGTPLDPNDFATEASFSFEVKMPEAPSTFDLDVQADLGGSRDQVFRVMLSDNEGGKISRGRPTWALIGDMKTAGYQRFRAGVMEFASLLPPNSHGEPTPADKDPIPDPFDNTYNVPEHDEFVVKVKYIRDDKFVVDNLLDPPQRTRVNHAWNDLYASFEYFDNYLRLLAKKFNFDLKGRGIAQMDAAGIASLPEAMRPFVPPLRELYDRVNAAQKAGRAGHLDDALNFASRAWRRPLTASEKASLRAFYAKTLASEGDHRKAVRALLARILVAPQFLYRVEPVSGPRTATAQPLSNWDLAGRLSFFLWSSIPDDELRRAASAGELTNPDKLRAQVKRMLADPKARRFSTEFFGQWLGFYRFDQYRGVDTTRFPEFTNEVKAGMYDEAVSFFEYIVRNDKPVRDLLFADYTFLNKPLAKHYGVPAKIESNEPQLVTGANAFQRGGLLRLGAVLTATSAPLRTSPVKRGDWLLRRVLGTPVPPPPADAGSIPADDKNFGGLTVKARLEVHKRNPTCANCHMRIDPMGFPLERYDSVGRWRDKYSDGKPIEDSAELGDKSTIDGVEGLLGYLRGKDEQVRRTLAMKLTGYALGRTVQASDLPLIDRMVAAGDQAGFSALAGEIATSRQFRYRAAPTAAEPKRTLASR